MKKYITVKFDYVEDGTFEWLGIDGDITCEGDNYIEFDSVEDANKWINEQEEDNKRFKLFEITEHWEQTIKEISQ